MFSNDFAIHLQFTGQKTTNQIAKLLCNHFEIRYIRGSILRCNKHIQVLKISYTTRETKTITMRKSIVCGLLLAAVIAVCFDMSDATCGRK